MKILKDRIDQEGSVIDNRILKVDSFVNQQIDPLLFQEVAAEIVRRFEGKTIDRVVTIESSGIAIAIMVALALKVPLVFARKKKSLLMNEELCTAKVYSYTKEEHYDISISKRFLPAGERVLIIDDFLASGEAALGLADVVKSAGDTVVGIAIMIEKSFQVGRARLEEAGYQVESMVRIARFEDNRCIYVGDADA